MAIVTPFVQVGTSCESAVSRGIDYTFTSPQRPEDVAAGIFPLPRWIHLDGDSNDLFEALEIQMPSFHYQLADAVKPFHIRLFRRHHRIRTKMGENTLHQMPHVSYFVLDSLIGSIRPDESALPPSLEHVEDLRSVRVLAHREARPNLPTEPVSPARLERNAEAAFTVYESRNIRSNIHREGPGPASYAPNQPGASRDLTPESLRGSPPLEERSYPRYYPRRTCMRRRKGFTDLSRYTNEITLALGNVTYPTRNFAQTCYHGLSRGAGHFCRPLHVAMQLGLYLRPVSRRLAYSL